MLRIIRYDRGVQLNLPLQVGSRLENYRILRVLAAGGFSFVYLAHDDEDAPVVIKGVMSPEDARTALNAGVRGVIVSDQR